MKRVSLSIFLGFLLMVIASHDSYAEIRGHGGVVGFQEKDMHLTRQMRHCGMKIMEMMPGAEHHMWGCLMELGLDDKQKTEVKGIKSRVMKEMIKKSADEYIANIELRDLLDKDTVDMKAIEAKLKQIETIKTEMHLSLIRAREEVKSKLTPEQRKKFNEMTEMEPDIGPPMLREMMHGGMSIMPPPPPR